MAIRAILFDVMGTLVHDPFFEEMPAFFGISLRELIAIKHPDAWVRFEHGQIDEGTLLDEFFADRRAFDRDGFTRTVRGAYRFLPGIEPLLEELGARGIEMHAFSNYPSWYRWIEGQLALSRFLGWTFVSCETGHRKPDRRAYEHARDALGYRADECLFVDDREVNCEAARGIGMDAIRFVDAAQLRRELGARALL